MFFALSSAVCTMVAYIANNMWTEGSSLIEVHSISFNCRIILKCICIFAGDVISRRHFQDKNNVMIRVNGLTFLYFNISRIKGEDLVPVKCI